jgi:hypothetical protein
MRRPPAVLAILCLLALGAALMIPPTAYSEREISLLFSLFAAAFVAVGGLLAMRRPEHLVGRLMLAIGVLLSVGVASGQYAGYALLRDPSLPLGLELAWLGTWVFVPVLGLMSVLLLVFPHERLAGRRNVTLARVAVGAAALATAAQAFLPGPMDGFGDLQNPFGIAALEGPLRLALTASFAVAALAFLAATVIVFARLRRAHGDERQQLKWFAYAAALLVVCQLPNALPFGVDSSLLGLLLVVVALTAVPAAVAVAIMKYRLYDIDVVINRTLVYGALTATLGATYFALVLLIGLTLGESNVAIAVSTLAVAALFRPARARIQAAVDRRFYRRRYDAELTLAAFSTRLRDELDLEALSRELRGVVGDTVQPMHVSLWLKEAP